MCTCCGQWWWWWWWCVYVCLFLSVYFFSAMAMCGACWYWAVVLAACICLGGNAKEVTLKLEVHSAFRAPDGVETEVVVANGELPGPAVYLDMGDTLIIHIENRLEAVSMSLHCHGFLNHNNSWYDGPGRITQCPVPSFSDYTYYNPSSQERGTYWWHDHHTILRTYGLHGAIIIRDPEDPVLAQYKYIGEHVVMIGDWYHAGWSRILTGLMQDTTDWKWPGEPDSMLLNGIGCYGLHNATGGFDEGMLGRCYNNTRRRQAGLSPESGVGALHAWDVEAGNVYRLRLIGVTGMMMVTYAIQEHRMIVVEADGHYVEPYEVDSIEVNSGQRFSVIVAAKAQPEAATYWMVATSQFRKEMSAVGLLRYNGAASALPSLAALEAVRASNVRVPSLGWRKVTTFDAALHSGHATHFIHRQMALKATAAEVRAKRVPQRADRTLYLMGTQAHVYRDGTSCTPYNFTTRVIDRHCDGTEVYKVWTMNNTVLHPPVTPLLLSQYMGRLTRPFPDNVFHLRLNEVVDVILDNGPSLGHVSEHHPWHLHGHTFWLIGQEVGPYDARTAKLNLDNPSVKDSITAYPHTWTQIRFVADNPGVWLLHCHIDWHTVMGMAVVFVEGDPTDLSPPPRNTLPCGNVSHAELHALEQGQPHATGEWWVYRTATFVLVGVVALVLVLLVVVLLMSCAREGRVQGLPPLDAIPEEAAPPAPGGDNP